VVGQIFVEKMSCSHTGRPWSENPPPPGGWGYGSKYFIVINYRYSCYLLVLCTEYVNTVVIFIRQWQQQIYEMITQRLKKQRVNQLSCTKCRKKSSRAL